MTDRFFRIPLDLPHAGRVAWRLQAFLERRAAAGLLEEDGPAGESLLLVGELTVLLAPCVDEGENPADAAECGRIVLEAARIGRSLVDVIEQFQLGDDRIGQAVRNLFECLELGEEGAKISLRAGENPNSALRP